MTFYQQILTEHIGSSCLLKNASTFSGGCINNTLKLKTNQHDYFLKWQTHTPDLFEKEALGLKILNQKSPIHSPEVIGFGQCEEKNYLLLTFEPSGRRVANFWIDFGEKLAEQHRISHHAFGLDHDNHIGRLHQKNTESNKWSAFFIDQRLRPQLILALQKGLLNSKDEADFETLFLEIHNLFPDEKPALLHGDLWNGNFMTGRNGEAFIFDPAIYYSHREMEIAFTTLFGGFDDAFYKSYDQTYPLAGGYEDRIDLCNLYPLLVHVNLFGSGYISSVRRSLRRYL